MEIGIIGAGSIGLLFASYLSKGADIIIYTRTLEQASALNQNGIRLQKSSRSVIAPVNAKPVTEWDGSEELTIIATKQYQLEALVGQLSSSKSSLLFLQNGMGHLKMLESLSAQNIYVGSVEQGAFKLDDYTVTHNGAGITNVAVYKGNPALLQKLAGLVDDDFTICLKDNYYEMLINKLVINAVINPLTALVKAKNGELLMNSFYFQTAQNLFSEISDILDLQNPDKYFSQIMTVCQNTAENHSSMLKDLDANRRTEIDAILGFIMDEAVKKDKNCPVTKCLYQLVKGKEHEGESKIC